MRKSLGEAPCLREATGRLENLMPEDAGRWGVMEVGEMVRHLHGAFRMAMGEEPVARVSVPIPRPTLKWLALRAPVGWPKGSPTVAELRKGTEWTRPGEFGADRAALLEAVARFGAARALLPEHPMLGSMGRTDWMRWGWLHTDHHLRQFGR